VARPVESAYLWKTVWMASPNDMVRGPFDWHAEDLGDLECDPEVWGDTPPDRDPSDLITVAAFDQSCANLAQVALRLESRFSHS
jgi:hypothetical protein